MRTFDPAGERIGLHIRLQPRADLRLMALGKPNAHAIEGDVDQLGGILFAGLNGYDFILLAEFGDDRPGD